MTMNNDVRDIDHGFDKLIRGMEGLDSHSVKVGIQSDAGEHDGVDLVDIAVWNEFGTKTIPARPFMRHTAENQADNASKVGDRYVGLVIEGKLNPVEVYKRIGEWYQGVQRDAVRSGPWVPNAPSTIAKKGSSRPLIDTGKMVNAIRYEVEDE